MSRSTWHHGGKTARERGYGTAWRRLRQVVLTRDRHMCQACLAKGRFTPATEVDHVIPKAKGGTDALDNLAALCTPCHREKTTRDSGGKPRPTFGHDGWPVQ